ncbi:hypothetical protein I4U23_020279 [Adineta vaga]|nr:hypothetical protein I4U23_020279 [Adineta vaga]
MVRQSVLFIIGLLVTINRFTQAKVVADLAVLDQGEIKPIEPRTDAPLPADRYLTCSYVGDPHLLPFSQPYSQYWCKNEGWELLLSNQYVSLYVLVHSSSTYQIHDYMLIFPEPTACTTGSSSNPLPCQGSGSPITSLQNGNSYTHFHRTQDLIIKIDPSGSYYNIYIWQSPKLVAESCGVCIKWNCEREGLWMTPNPVVPKLCDLYINAARERAAAAVDKRVIDVARTQCINDMQSTFDVHQAVQPAIALVLQDGIKELINGGKDQQSAFEKIESVKEEVFKAAEATSNELLANSGSICNDSKKCLVAFNSDATAKLAVKKK